MSTGKGLGRRRNQIKGLIKKRIGYSGIKFWVMGGVALRNLDSGSDWGDPGSQCARPGPDGLLGEGGGHQFPLAGSRWTAALSCPPGSSVPSGE